MNFSATNHPWMMKQSSRFCSQIGTRNIIPQEIFICAPSGLMASEPVVLVVSTEHKDFLSGGIN